MRIGVLGTGTVGQTLAGRLAELGDEVMVGTRDPGGTLRREQPDAMGNPPFRVWHERHPEVKLGTFAEAAGHGEALINATAGGASLDALGQAGEANLAGKLLLDVANGLDFSHGMPPSLLVANTDSLGEQIQRAFPDAKVVKALNTMTAAVMVNPGAVGNGDHHVFVCGNDPGAKAQASELLTRFGWRNVVDLGDITAARATEMVLPIWLRLMGTLQTPMFNFKVIT
jgi:8-hydroxy-5-deazaflavin:NADPH oxidoreductase